MKMVTLVSSVLGFTMLVGIATTCSAQAGFPSKAEIDKMTEPQRQEAEKKAVAEAAKMPDKGMSDSMPAGKPTRVFQGKFRNSDFLHRGSGDAFVYRQPDGSHLVRLERLNVTKGPDLYVYLAKHPDPDNSRQVKEGFLNLGKLKGNMGDQNYAIPPGTKIEDYKSVVIYCQIFGVLFSPAALAKAN
ncbi:MAG: DM13 domain-containing protein [Burkholderiales bacterium]